MIVTPSASKAVPDGVSLRTRYSSAETVPTRRKLQSSSGNEKRTSAVDGADGPPKRIRRK
jgi:hypothetical protein